MAKKPVEIIIIAKDGATKTIKGVANAVDDLGKAGSSVEKTSTAIDGIGESSSRSSSKVDQFVGTLEKVASVTAIIETGQKALDWVEEGNKVNSIASSYQKLAEAENVQADLLLGKMRTASKGYIDDVTLMAGANKALLQGGDELANELPKILQIAGAAAKANGGDIKQLYGDIVEGIVKAEPEILDNAGLTLNLTQVYDDWAKSLGKTANELDQAEKSQALLNAVLEQGDGFLAKVGDSSLEAGSSLQKLKADIINAKNELQGLASVGLEELLSGGDFSKMKGDSQALESGADYSQYIQSLKAAKMETTALSQSQYEAAQAMVANGASADDTAVKMRDLKNIMDEIRADDGIGMAFAMNLGNLALVSESAADRTDRLEKQINKIAAASPEAAAATTELLNTYNEHQITTETLMGRLDLLEMKYVETTNTTFGYADAQEMANEKFDEATSSAATLMDALFALTDAEWEMSEGQVNAINTTLDQALAAEELAAQNDILNSVMAGVMDGTYSQADAMNILTNQLGLQGPVLDAMVAKWINLHNAIAGRLGSVSGINAAKQLKGAIDYTLDPPNLTPAYEKPKKGRSGSKRNGSGGKSEEVKEREREEKELAKIEERIAKTEEKFNKQAEKLEQDHVKRRQAIWDDFYKKQLAALEKFNRDKFGDQLSFFDSLKGMEDEARTRAIAKETEAWEKSQQLAATKGPQVADEWYKMRIEQIKADEDRAAAIADLEQKVTDEMDAAQKARLQNELNYQKELDRRHDVKDQEDLKRLEDGGDQLAKERDEQLADEDQRFKESQDDLLANYKETLEEVAGKTDEFTSRIVSAIDTMIAGFDRMASAAGTAASASGGGEVDGSHAGGLFRVPYDNYIAKLHKGERVLTRMEAKDYDRITSRPMPRGGDMRIPSAPMVGSSSRTTINNRAVVHASFGNGAPRAEVAAARGDLQRMYEDSMAEMARDDKRKKFMGG
ncbi:hypothetical protein [Herpetosiphon geysericola]|uniref:Bacteriophage tail tape measure C-terminal domain-containing protein n=1 Tax=Herpetosiphon geysericola TaxID=70996 RepID=A0A0P6YBT1_9CHLR|nr:hypothetical protein [Herpetosiphon geysericola]KPL90756.1 hypothetical protein SE18_05160 [Herpetosiphon geysericola]